MDGALDTQLEAGKRIYATFLPADAKAYLRGRPITAP